MTKLAVRRLIAWFGTPLALSLSAGCSMEAVDEGQIDEANVDEGSSDPASRAQPDGIGKTERGLNTVVGVNFEGYSVGELGSPWSLTPASSPSGLYIESTSDHGNVMRLDGAQGYGDFLIGRLAFSISSDVVASTDINPDSGSAFVFSLHGQGVGTYKRRVRLQRWPGSSTLVATAVPSGDTDCGSLASDTWSNIALVFHAQRTPHTFDVLINGQPTACSGLEVVTEPPFTSVQIMDASNMGW